MVTENVIIKFRADGTRVVQRQIKNVGKESKTSAGSVNFLQKALVSLGGVLVLRQAIRTLADFEQEMSTVQAVTNATADDFAQLRDRAKELGSTTRFSATEAAQGLVNLSRAGFDTQETLVAVGDTLLLAQAGAVGLNDAAALTAKTIRGFNLSADESGRVVDVLVKTANSASTNVLELGEALKFVQPVSVQLGISLETTSAALGVLADNALGGSIGGTGLTKVLSTLAKGTPDLTKAIKRAGLEVSDFDVATLGLTPVLENLGKLNLGVGESFKIFGDRGVKAAAVLIANASKVGEFNKEIENAGGIAQRTADIMDDNLNGALLSVRSAFEAVILSFGDLGPTNLLTQAFRSLADALRFVADNAEIVGIAIAGLAATAIPALIKGIKALTLAIAANPLGILLFAVGAGIAALIAFRDEILVTGDGITTFGDVAAVAFETFKRAFESAVEVLSALTDLSGLDIFQGEVKLTFENVALFAAQAFDLMVGVAKGAFLSLVTVFQVLPSAFKNLFFTAINFILEAINNLLIGLQLQINSLLEEIEVLAAKFGKALDLGRLKIPLAELVDTVGPTFGELGKIVGQEFRANIIESVGAQTLVASIFDEAKERGAIAAAEAAEEAFLAARAKIDELVQGEAGRFGPGPAVGVPGRVKSTTREVSGKGAEKEAKAVKELIKALKQEGELLLLTGAARALKSAEFEVLAALKKDDIKLNSQQADSLKAQVAEETRANEVLAEKRRLLDVLGPTEEDRNLTQMALNEILAEGNFTQAERNKLIKAAGGEMEQATGFAKGFASAFDKIDTSAQGLGESIGGALVRGIDKGSAALAEFLVTGARDTEALKEAVANLLRDLAKEVIQLIIKLLIVAAIKKALGGDAFSAPGASGLQAGGFVQAGAGPVLVGERGPEPFIPTVSGRVEPNAAIQPAAPANVTVVNVTDPEEISAFLNSEEGGEVILNQLAKRRKQAQQTLGI